MERKQFFKVFTAEESLDKLLIPTGFMERVMEEEDGSALLVCPNGEEWRVSIVEENNFWFFKRGWNTFVEENSIGDMDAMLFTYAGSMKFNVKFFLSNGLKKPTEGGVCGYSVVSLHTTRKRPRVEPERKHGTNATAGQPHGLKKPTEVGARSKFGVSPPPVTQTTQRVKPQKKHGKKGITGQPHVVTSKEQDVADTMSTNRPFFVRTLIWRPGQFPVLHVTDTFLKQNGLTLDHNQKIGLRNILGGRWLVKVNRCKGAFAFGKGFPLFLHKNGAGDGNTLVYEVIDNASMEIMVHFYR